MKGTTHVLPEAVFLIKRCIGHYSEYSLAQLVQPVGGYVFITDCVLYSDVPVDFLVLTDLRLVLVFLVSKLEFQHLISIFAYLYIYI